MASYIISSDSWSACGKGNKLNFQMSQYDSLTTAEQENVPFFKMAQLPIDNTEQRILSTLTEVVQSAISKAELDETKLAETAIILGSTSLDISIIKPQPEQPIWLTDTDRLSAYLQQTFNTSALHLTVNTACTASTNALILADQLLRQDKAKYAIVIGCEFYNPLTLEGFYSLDLITKHFLQTFSSERSGLILGEAVAAVVLGQSAKSQPSLKVCGYGSGCDHYSLTMTEESGQHIATVVQQALDKAKLNAEQIDLIKVHGTATLNNDQAEANAFSGWLDHAPIFALKPFTGHTLGACGVLEIALMEQLLTSQNALPIPAYGRSDNNLKEFAPSVPLTEFKHILLNHCGFGGNNAALILEVCQNAA